MKKEDVVVNEIMKESVDKFILERIEENKDLFTKEEMKIIKNNMIITKKIYLLGGINFYNI